MEGIYNMKYNAITRLNNMPPDDKENEHALYKIKK